MAKNHNKKRLSIQILWTALSNGYLQGFFKGTIFQGASKQFCLPGLNCYSCPGALGACPIGALQAVVGSWKYQFSYYILGFFILVGGILGRFVCGFLCPFGLVQDLLHKIPFAGKRSTLPMDRQLRYLKYAILGVFVLWLPAFSVDILGQGEPYFCKLICPSGTLLGGIPLVAMNPELQEIIGGLFVWKSFILVGLLLLSMVVYRPFCKYLCPLGGVYGLFNKIAFYKLQVSADNCVNCGCCAKACKMQVNPVVTPNHTECIRCGDCKAACPKNAISLGFHP